MTARTGFASAVSWRHFVWCSFNDPVRQLHTGPIRTPVPRSREAVASRLDALIRSVEWQRFGDPVAEVDSNCDGRNTDDVSDSDAEVLPFITPDQGETSGR